ncbi:Tyrosine recombinase XerC [Planctomycetes bacterium LzC2]|uniref:Tyrosine recombinase XerC n=1 Tax=Alienimonas chondri TaxID=2681879 RepID=A0ABX1V9Z3_9PLAN|nr:Tyrosine recombinase XerC [Alienimonas chondri]
MIGQWQATGQTPAKATTATVRSRRIAAEVGPPVNDVILAFWQWAARRYPERQPGRMNGEPVGYKIALKLLRSGREPTSATSFGPIAVRECQRMMVAEGRSRTYCNMNLCRLKRVFKWAVSWEMIPPSVLTALQTVEGLRKGEPEAKEPEAKEPEAKEPEAKETAARRGVDPEHDASAWKRLGPRNRDLIHLQLWTGSRPAELLNLTTRDIDRAGVVWLATLGDHKTAHLGKARTLCFGPKCQKILAKYLDDRAPDVRLFRTSVNTLRQAAAGACRRSGAPRWTPYQLRHSFAYRARAEAGLYAAQKLLGHSSAKMTEGYASADLTSAIQSAAKAG